MTTPEQLAETVRAGLVVGRSFGDADAYRALDSLLAACEVLRQERDANMADALRMGSKAVDLEAKAEAAEREVERLNHESAALENEGRRLRDYLENKGGYCVACGIRYVPNEALKRCDESTAGLSHLWAKNGHVEDWFPVKRDKRGRELNQGGRRMSIRCFIEQLGSIGPHRRRRARQSA